MSDADAQVPTMGTLLLLFADQVVPRDTVLTIGVEVPCNGVKVQQKPLAGVMLAAAFASLRDKEVVTLELVQKKGLLKKTTHVQVSPIRTVDAPGLEGELLRVLGQGPATVRDLVLKWFDRDRYNPWFDVVERGLSEGESLGNFRTVEVERGMVAGYVLGRTRLEPECERIAALRPAFMDVHERWQRFERDEPDLFHELTKECAKAIAAREHVDTDTG